MTENLNKLRLTNPSKAKELRKILTAKDPKEDYMRENIEDIVKFYPGSKKGPLPEDDPAHYSEWFMRNQPVDEIYGKGANPSFRDIGVKTKEVYKRQLKNDDSRMVEYHDDIEH